MMEYQITVFRNMLRCAGQALHMDKCGILAEGETAASRGAAPRAWADEELDQYVRFSARPAEQARRREQRQRSSDKQDVQVRPITSMTVLGSQITRDRQ